MGYQSIVHGRITLDSDFKKSQEFIKSIGKNNEYTHMTAEMYGLGITEITYDQKPVIVFGATYKQIEYDWSCFVLEFESVLRNISFDTAKITLETEIYGTYNFFWKSKHTKESFDSKEHLIETDAWFFGFGNRDRWGFLERELEASQIFDFENFKYPVNIKKNKN